MYPLNNMDRGYLLQTIKNSNYASELLKDILTEKLLFEDTLTEVELNFLKNMITLDEHLNEKYKTLLIEEIEVNENIY